ncbi:hypothetical protein ACH5RR_005960 [Cinchona calisaya]|uniref:Uncharacterized protein n=1 Tax=Cinchona calisaya TaxID=153742 RepID=A0ABD3AMR2_9GENT
MFLAPMMLRSLAGLVKILVVEPAASITSLLYFGDLLPRNTTLERLVRHELLDQDNFLFNLLINFLRCLS